MIMSRENMKIFVGAIGRAASAHFKWRGARRCVLIWNASGRIKSRRRTLRDLIRRPLGWRCEFERRARLN